MRYVFNENYKESLKEKKYDVYLKLSCEVTNHEGRDIRESRVKDVPGIISLLVEHGILQEEPEEEEEGEKCFLDKTNYVCTYVNGKKEYYIYLGAGAREMSEKELLKDCLQRLEVYERSKEAAFKKLRIPMPYWSDC